MEYCTLKFVSFSTLIFLLSGCNSMDVKANSDNSKIEYITEISRELKQPNDFFGYDGEKNYYVSLNAEDTKNFSGIGKYISNDNNLKLMIKSVERDVKQNQSRSEDQGYVSLNLTKSGKSYYMPFQGDNPSKYEFTVKLKEKLETIKSQAKSKNTSCEYCFTPSYRITKMNDDGYEVAIKFKNIGTNPFDLAGISELVKVGRNFKSDAMLQIDFGDNNIQLDKQNLIDQQFLDVIHVPKDSDVQIKFKVSNKDIPAQLKSIDLSKANSSAYLLTKFKNGELNQRYFDMSTTLKY